MERRKDTTGKVLKEGESQRKDGRYQYRYTDITGKRCVVYAKDIRLLRIKEAEIQKLMDSGVKSISLKMTVRELVEKYVDLHKTSVKPSTYMQLESFKERIKTDPFGKYPISEVTTSAAKIWLTSLYNSGLAYGTVNNFKAMMRPAFDMALDDNLIVRNPFDFSLSKVVKNTATEKRPISADEYSRLIMFAQNDARFYKHVDELVLLYETGLRVSELCGLTFADIDLEENVLRIRQQVVKSNTKTRCVQSLKTKKSERIIPISPKAKESILNLIINRPKVTEKEVDGYKDFLIITRTGRPKLNTDIEDALRRLIAVYNKEHPDNPLPRITPHTFRHTFCSRMIMSGMNIRTVQYLMGHSSASVTLNVYTHIMASSDVVEEFENKVLLNRVPDTRQGIAFGSTPLVLTPSSSSVDTTLTPLLQN